MLIKSNLELTNNTVNKNIIGYYERSRIIKTKNRKKLTTNNNCFFFIIIRELSDTKNQNFGKMTANDSQTISFFLSLDFQ